MSVDQALRLSSILLACASFIGLAMGASLPVWLQFLTASVLILVLLRTLEVNAIDKLANLVTLSGTTWNIFLILAFLGFWVDLVWLSGELLPAGTRFLLILMVIKLFNLQRRRDYLHLYAISFMAVLASAALTTDLWYLPLFLVYLLTGVWALLLFQLTKRSDDMRGPVDTTAFSRGAHQTQSYITPQLFWLANGLVLGTLGLTILIFFAIPRVNAGFFQKGYGDSIRTSGFSNTVNLGALGPIKRDPSIVMRVELPDRNGPQPGPLYLRGTAYDHYDGITWSNRLTHRYTLHETAPMTFRVRHNSSRSRTLIGPTVRQNILLESLDTTVLFAAPYAETVTGRFFTIQADSMGALYLPFPNASRIEYSVISRLNPLSPGDLQPQTVEHSDSFANYFLQAPVQSERIGALAREITKNEDTSYEKAVAIEHYLSRHYRYSLDVPMTEQVHPLETFLFTRKTGYCEHYATAMAVMLRTIGIPTRLVTGFLATEWNEYGNYYVVRQQDAHAWVEIHLAQSGWVVMDPTPTLSESEHVTRWQALGRILDSLRLKWNRFFVQYSAADQLAVVRELKAGSESIRTRAWDSVTAFFYPLAARFGDLTRYVPRSNYRLLFEYLGLVMAGLSALIWLAWKRPWTHMGQSRLAARDEQAITHVYKTMIHHLAQRGIVKATATPPFAFTRTIHDQWNSASSPVVSITELYCRVRFGHTPLTKEELLLAHRNLQQLMAMEGP